MPPPDGNDYDHYDQSRLGGTAAVQVTPGPENNYLVATYEKAVAVHVFAKTVVIVGNNGQVTTIRRA